MNPLFPKLAAAAVALTAARAALACDERPVHAGVAVHLGAALPLPPFPAIRVAPITVPVPVPVVRVEEERWGQGDRDGWSRGDGRRWDHERWEQERRRAHLREAQWRAAERARLSAEYARLDDARADFYARPHRGWEARRFERWYADARADLDLRWSRLGLIAMR